MLQHNTNSFFLKSPLMRRSLNGSQILKRNPQLVTNLLQWLTKTPTVSTFRVNLLKTTSEEFQKHVVFSLDKKYHSPPQVYLLSDLPEVVCISQLNVEQETSTSTSISNSTEKHIIVDIICGAALLRGAQLYSGGVLAMEKHIQSGELVLVFADLAGKCKKGLNVRYENEHKLYIGKGRVCMQRHQIFSPTGNEPGIAVLMLRVQSNVPSVGNLADGLALLQNLPSMVCVRALNAQPGEIVLDMCAAPGNKTTHIAELMEDQGVIVALDISEKRVMHLKRNTQHFNCIKCYCFDAGKALEREKFGENGAPPYAANSFDRILLDAPCSGLGNRPVLAIDFTDKMLESYPCLQRKLFDSAVALLKPEGTLVYSTCTITEDENECMVAWALEKYPELQLVDALPRFGGYGLKNTNLTEEQRLLVQRFGPEDDSETRIDTVGFFIAKFKKLNKEICV